MLYEKDCLYSIYHVASDDCFSGSGMLYVLLITSDKLINVIFLCDSCNLALMIDWLVTVTSSYSLLPELMRPDSVDGCVPA